MKLSRPFFYRGESPQRTAERAEDGEAVNYAGDIALQVLRGLGLEWSREK